MSVTVSESSDQLIFPRNEKSKVLFRCKLSMGGRQMAENQAIRRSSWYKTGGSLHTWIVLQWSRVHIFLSRQMSMCRSLNLISPLDQSYKLPHCHYFLLYRTELNIKQFSNLLTDCLDRITDIFVWKNSNIWDTAHAPGIISYPSGVLCACANSIETISVQTQCL